MHRNIQLQEGCGDISLQRSGEHWHASGDAGELARASVAIVACGTASQSQQGLEWLPLQSIRGQVTELPSSGALSNLRTVICHSGYLAPARQGLHCIGATFDLDTADGSIRPADHESNLAELQQALPSLTADLAAVDREQLGGRVGFRCASPDYLPVVGPVPERDAFCEDYAGLRKNARRRIPKTGSYLPGLYVSTGHGSRGLTSTPLASEILAAEINGEPWPVDTPLYRALAPARFLVRDLVRNRI
jgi:tRNA 5-methylaminomethyl-2-thiouridine biosynthesis bifunctional protein